MYAVDLFFPTRGSGCSLYIAVVLSLAHTISTVNARDSQHVPETRGASRVSLIVNTGQLLQSHQHGVGGEWPCPETLLSTSHGRHLLGSHRVAGVGVGIFVFFLFL